jgi:hypothetical protein
MDVIHKRRPQVAATTLALNSFSWLRSGTNEVSIKRGPKSCVQGDAATRSSLPLLTQTLRVLKPWPPNFVRLAPQWGIGASSWYDLSISDCKES